jgi:hypothetical protein
MKDTVRWMLIFGVILLLASVPQNVLLGQDEQQPNQTETQPDQDQSQSAEPAQDQTQTKSAQPIAGLEQEGKLKAVDPDKKIFLIVDANDKEMLFHYDDQTEVAGQAEGVQGLTGSGGTWLRIQYRAEGENAIAEKIEQIDHEESAAPSEAQPRGEEANPAPPEVPSQESPRF